MEDGGELEAGPEVKTTFMILGQTARPVQYTVVDGLALVEGCIIIGTAEEAEESFQKVLSQPGLLRPGVATQGSGIIGRHYRWPNRTMIYEIDPGLQQPNRVEEAMAHWEANTQIRFVRRDRSNAAHRDYVAFVNGSGCSSAVGRRGGRQFITLGPDCTVGNTIHEIGHALGLWHEQSRIDRDVNVRIIWSRIKSGTEHNFSQHIHDGIDLGPYDFGSIMHYPVTAFSKDGQPTIELRKPFGGTVGQRDGLSEGDRAAIRALYS